MSNLETSVTQFDVKSVTDQGEFSGYASVFGVKDSHSDIVTKGAYRNSLAKRPAGKVKMLMQHEGSPIGKWLSLVEDDHGLKATGQLMLSTTAGKDAYELLRAGLLDSLSIGFKTVKDRYDRTKGARILEELSLWEISLVTFPSNTDATITSVKSESSTQFRALVEAINHARNSLSK